MGINGQSMRRASFNISGGLSALMILTAGFCLPVNAGEAPAAGVAAALAQPDRSEKDLEADGRRKPAEVLGFFGLQPGMTVLEMFAGGGYYTEILSYAVGDAGVVWAHNNTPYLEYAKDEITARFTPDRPANVKPLTAENNELELPADTFDLALLILAYHDVYHVHEESGWLLIDGPKMLAEIYQSMKPGSVLGVVDHVAEAGAPAETGNSLHRIDPALMKKEIVAAGFVFDGESDVLLNPSDDVTRHAFDPKSRGKTDRVIYRFVRP